MERFEERAMKQLERFIRDELLTEKNTTCLSIYVPDGDVKLRCDWLKELIVEATEFLSKNHSVKEMEAFLRPLHQINHKEMEEFGGGVAFFRSANSFRALKVSADLKKECVVSNHFYIKPLLKWLQEDREFVCVDFSKSNVSVFRGDAYSFSAADFFGISPWDTESIDNCVSDNSDEHQESLVFLSGNEELAREYWHNTRLPNVDRSVVTSSAFHGNYEKLWEILNDRMRHRSIAKVKKSLLDYSMAVMNGNARSELEEVIEAAKLGKISKLIISQDDQVWGRFDAYKNNTNRVNKQINYEDDDLLDSISERVLEDGGEVILASHKQLPKGKTVLAILKEAG